ncbi:hypothetical protein AB2G98_25190 (plasmid) [Escherichia coli]
MTTRLSGCSPVRSRKRARLINDAEGTDISAQGIHALLCCELQDSTAAAGRLALAAVTGGEILARRLLQGAEWQAQPDSGLSGFGASCRWTRRCATKSLAHSAG